MANTICNNISSPVLVTETCSAPDSTKELLISIIEERRSKLEICKAPKRLRKPQICKAPELLRKDEKSAKSFEPEVVAIGPYHRGRAHLVPAEDHKRTAAVKFTSQSGHSIDDFHDKIKKVAAEARECYADAFDLMTEEEFILMLFLDGCFVLHFIDCFVGGDMKEGTMSTHLHGFIIRDMFLLENQLPFVVVDALMSLKQVKLDAFFSKITGTELKSSSSATRDPYHLLDLLRTELLGAEKGPWQLPGPGPKDLHLFRSVKELREVGIRFRRGKNDRLSAIDFRPCAVWGTLSLPGIVVDDLTRSRFLNMIALEMHLGSAGDYGITSFVWFLDCLIDRAEDVRELREEGILLNALGSDEQVAELFNELATNLAPDFKAYGQVLDGISNHRKNRFNVSIYTFLHTHFSTPWTAIAFIAAVLLLAMSVIQTIFTVYPRG